MVENPRPSNKKKFNQELIVVPRLTTEVLNEYINNRIEIEVEKSPSDKKLPK